MTNNYCPYCNYDLGLTLLNEWYDSNSPLVFEFDCPECEGRLEIDVEARPEFYIYPLHNVEEFREYNNIEV